MTDPIIPFLSLVAKDLTTRFGNHLADIAVIFPSRRARLFFDHYLSQQSDAPVWAPHYFSLEELFEQASDLRQADSIKLICELYKTYTEIYNAHATSLSEETLDEFYFFGEILLNDFDEVDKYLINARSLFSNLQDLDQLRDDFSHLSESQREALSRYFKHTFQGETSLQTAFCSIWNILGEVYFTFKEKLKKEGIAYPGMLMRSVLEDEYADFNHRQYVFVGFNVLTQCEEKLFEKLHDKALFYWDVDSYYLNDQESPAKKAGQFISGYIKRFGSALEIEDMHNFLAEEKEITLIASPSESAQSAAILPWIQSLKREPSFTEPDSAIVLCNESLLPVVMHSIPPELVENVNITMGFPITQSPVCSFLQALTEMQLKAYSSSGKTFRYNYVLPVLRHPYTQLIFPEAKKIEKELIQNRIFSPEQETLGNKSIFIGTSNAIELADYLITLLQQVGMQYEKKKQDSFDDLYKESIFRAYQVINRLAGLMDSGELAIEKTTFLRLMKKLFSTITIPFHGEPIKGLQIMGVLETRTLDFNHLILLNVNEGQMPGSNNENTFIPQFIRKQIGMSMIDHQDSIYAYYFYRLIQRAKKITFVYNTDKTQIGKSEMSRFLLQLLIDSRLKINRFSLQSTVKPIQPEPIKIEKDEAIMQKIKAKYDCSLNPEAHTLSPSALNVFIDCSLRFYLVHIEAYKQEEELSDELDSAIFGTIFHKAAELLYRKIGRISGNEIFFPPFLVEKEHLEPFIQHPHLMEKLVFEAFNKEYFKGRELDLNQYNGKQLINFRVICHLLKRLVEFDRQNTPFYIHGIEYPVFDCYNLPNSPISLKIGGIIDRLEEKNGVLRIVDYKTSGKGKTYKEIEELIIQKENRASHIFQTFTYASILTRKEYSPQAVIPALLYLQEAVGENYSPVILHEKEAINDFKQIHPAFLQVLEQKMIELFDPDIPFLQTSVLTNCSYCDFKSVCNR